MAILTMLQWWYGAAGWKWVVYSIGRRLDGVNDVFAIRVLLKTWFAPWKQITTAYANETWVQRLLDKLISRVVGTIIRTGALIGAVLWAAIITLGGMVLLVSWAFLPLTPLIFMYLFLTGVGV